MCDVSSIEVRSLKDAIGRRSVTWLQQPTFEPVSISLAAACCVLLRTPAAHKAAKTNRNRNYFFLLHLLIWSQYCLHPHVSFLASASPSLFNHLPSPSSPSPHPPFYCSPKSIPPFCSCSYPPHWPPLCTAAPIQPLISEVPPLWRTLWVCVSLCHTAKSRTND